MKTYNDNDLSKDERIAVLEKEVRHLTFELNINVFGRIGKLENSVSVIEKENRYNDTDLLPNCFNAKSNNCNEIKYKNRELKGSTMMTLNEVKKQYNFKYSKNDDTIECSNGIRINSMDAVAGCRDVSSLAYAFYFNHFKLMTPQFIDGWLVSLLDEDQPLILRDDSKGTKEIFSQTGTEMKCYRLDTHTSCVWQQDTRLDSSEVIKNGSKYCKHSAITVVLNEGETVIVDWNIGQFRNLIDGNFIFVI